MSLEDTIPGVKFVTTTARRRPILSTIIAVLIGGGGLGGANYDYIVSWLTLPDKVERIERYMKADIRKRVESGKMTVGEALELMFPSDTADGG